MSAPVSVIIPTLNTADRIGPLLGALGEAVIDGLLREVIIADGGSTDDIETIAEMTGATFVTAPAGRGQQLVAGAEASSGAWLLILHADSVPEPGWTVAVHTHLRDRTDRAGYFALRFNSGHPMARITAAWANFRSRVLALPYGDQGLLIPRTLYRDCGGYPDWPLMEDVALVRRIGRRRIAQIGATVTTSAARYEQDGWLRRGARNLTTLGLYFAGRSPKRLLARYNRQ